MPSPIIVPRHKTETRSVCDKCASEKSEGRDRGWAAGDDLSDVTFTVVLPLDEDRRSVQCPHGHAHIAVREGSPAHAQFS